MANEINVTGQATGLTVYVNITNSVGQILNSLTFETPVEANRSSYARALTEANLTGDYRGTFPVLAAGVYGVAAFSQLGGSPAATDTLLGGSVMQWSGTAEIPLSTISALFTTQLTESYAAEGVAPTPAQALFMIQQMLMEFDITGTTLTVKKLNQLATAGTFEFDSSTDPTSITRVT